jgi:hypothetical protein
MKKNTIAFFLTGLLILIAGVFVYGVFRFRAHQIDQSESRQRPEGVVTGTFGSTKDYSPDDAQLRRLIRGDVTLVEDDYFRLSTMVNWPEKERRMDMRFELSPQTQYLCWPANFKTANGELISVADSTFLLTDESRLMLQGETPLTKAQAIETLKRSSSVLVALEKNYAQVPARNTAFQIAIVGCKDD